MPESAGVTRPQSPSTFPADDQLLTTDQLAALWGCTRKHIYSLFADGLPSVSLRRARRIRLSDANAWLDDHRHGSQVAAQRLVSDRVAQGLPPEITDPATVAQLAAAVASTDGKKVGQ
jgi:excisionase family DNA binding protein